MKELLHNIYFSGILLLLTVILCGSFFCSNEGSGADGDKRNPCSGENGIVYVSISGNDINTGTRALPKQTIQEGINCALSISASKVYVSQGTYTVNGSQRFLSDPPAGIIMKEGVSLYGGYSPDWNSRDADIYTTAVQDSSSDYGLVGAPNRALYFGNTITDSTLFEGFTVTGGGGDYCSAILVDGGAPVIQNNMLNGGSGAGSMAYAVYNVDSASPLIQNNKINGGSGAVYTHGIYIHYSTADIISNEIYGGSGSTSSKGVNDYYSASLIFANNFTGGFSSGIYGIACTGSNSYIINNIIKTGGMGGSKTAGISINTSQVSATTYIYNNTIDGGDGTLSAIGIDLNNTATVIENNIIFLTGGGTITSFGIREQFDFSDPVSVKNNSVYNCTTGLYRDHENPFDYMTQVDSGTFSDGSGHTLTTPVGTGNVSANANLDSGFNLTASTPVSVSSGSGDLSSLFTTDFNGSARTVPWSIGAFERD